MCYSQITRKDSIFFIHLQQKADFFAFFFVFLCYFKKKQYLCARIWFLRNRGRLNSHGEFNATSAQPK